MDKHIALSPCPFCGGEARLVNCGSPMVVCLHGCCQIVDDKNSVEHWNTRPIEDELRAELARRDEKIAELLKVYGECKDAIARRDEVIRKLKEDGERLFSGLKDFDGTRGWKICKFCHAEMEFVDHAPDCPITLHRALMKELEEG